MMISPGVSSQDAHAHWVAHVAGVGYSFVCVSLAWDTWRLHGQHCVVPVEPQSPNGNNINLHKKWGFRRFQKECQKVLKTALFAHFLALFLESAETPLFVQISVVAVRALRLDRKRTRSACSWLWHLSLLNSRLVENGIAVGSANTYIRLEEPDPQIDN